MNKSGVSAVVATVLIVMITVAAVGLLWAIVSPFLKSNITDKTACVEAEMAISVDASSKYTCVSADNGTAIRVSRGSDDNVWKSVQVIYTDSNGNSEKVSYASPPAKNSNKVYRNVNMTDVVKMSVLPILEGRGDDLVCSKTVELPSVKSCSTEVEASLVETSEEYVEGATVFDLLALEGIVSYWNFNDDWDGILTFDGVDDYFDTGVVGTFSVDEDVEIKATLSSDHVGRIIFAGNYNDVGPGSINFEFSAAGKFRFYLSDSSGLVGDLYTTPSYYDGSVQNVTAFYDGATKTISITTVDGTVSLVRAFTGSFGKTTPSYLIGTDQRGSNFFGPYTLYNISMKQNGNYLYNLAPQSDGSLYDSVSDVNLTNQGSGKVVTNELGVALDSVGSNNGTYGGDAYAEDGVLILDGTGDYVTTPFLTDGYINLSFSTWIKADLFETYGYIMDSSSAGGCGMRATVSNSVEFFCYSGGSANVVSDTGLSTDTWYHYVFVQDASGSKIYRDGVYIAANAQDDSSGVSAGTAMVIGAEFSGGNPFTGSMDEVIVFDRVLSAEEVAEIYAAGR